jgi:hypothetical protein
LLFNAVKEFEETLELGGLVEHVIGAGLETGIAHFSHGGVGEDDREAGGQVGLEMAQDAKSTAGTQAQINNGDFRFEELEVTERLGFALGLDNEADAS